MCLPKFVDVLEAVSKKSWKNILTSKEKAVADKLFDRILRIKESDNPTTMGIEIVVVFLKRCIQPVMSRVHQIWLYSGPKDETRVNIAELSEKELLDEVRRLTHFSQEDSIPLLALQEPYDFDHQQTEVNLSPVYENLEEGGSTVKIESCAKDNEVLEEEDNDPANPKAFSADHRYFADDLSDTAESNHDNDVDRAPFVDAAPEKTSAQPPNRPSGGFSDEDALLDFDEGFIEPPSKKTKASPSRPTPVASEASALPVAAAAQPSTASSLSKGKEVPSAATISPSSSEKSGIQTAITILKGFTSQFSSLEADKARLQEEVQSTSSKLDQAIKMAAAAHQNADSLKKELDQLKKKLKEEEKEKAEAQAQRKEREDLLHKSTLPLLEAANIPSGSVGKLPDGSSADAISLAIESGDLV
ncbi:hypothetical protein QYE76_050386 [Lolium multiflorum]|uniref:Uncharacterized protein n=1 Tax=Lolium multiflorum TaxID=4521 RepID=A0AAD8WGX6_LOLMU|nr:hypothetical protein QYE76_050386 [Lolium multiflorum]